MKRRLLLMGCCVFFCEFAVAEEVITDEVKDDKIVIDFETSTGLVIDSGPFTSAVVARDGGKALEIKSSARGGYPRVSLSPASGTWDFGDYDVVLMDVRNLDSRPVRVLLQVNGAKTDGGRQCNTESVVIPGKAEGVVRVPFGIWHGSKGNLIDRSAVTSVMVMLDKPKADHRFVVDNVRTVTYGRLSTEALYNSRFYKELRPFFGRGINLGNALEAPEEGRWGVVLKEDFFPTIKKSGFDNIRIPVRWSAHADKEPPYTVDESFFKRVDWAVERALSQKLKVVLNMHHYDAYFENVREHDARFLAIWRQIAARYIGAPDALCFELLNEPHGNMTAMEWNRIAAEAIKVIRKTNPQRWIMVGPVQYNNISRLKDLRLPEKDRKLVVTVHYYSPFHFTHQGATWAGEAVKQLKNVRWRGTEQERAAVRKDFDEAIAWGILHQRPIYLGEFGAYSPAAMADRALWTRCVSEEAIKRKMGYAYWEFCAGFGAYDQKRKAWNVPLLKALIW